MKQRQICFLILFLQLIFLAPSLSNELVNLPIDDDNFAILKSLSIRHGIDQLSNSRPISRQKIAELVEKLAKVKKLTPIETEQIDRLKRYFSQERESIFTVKNKELLIDFDPEVIQEFALFRGVPENQKNSTSITSIGLSLKGKFSKRFAIENRIYSRLFRGNERYRPTHASYNEATHNYNNNYQNLNSIVAYLSYRTPHWSIEMGRDELWWGPGWHGGLILSTASAPKDLLKISYEHDRFNFTAFTATLNESSAEKQTSKFMSAHRLEIVPFRGLRLGIDEVVVYGNRFEASYLNPLLVYFISEPEIATSPDNRLIGFDFDLTRFRAIEFYGQLMVDDFQPQKGIKSFRDVNTKFGVLAGTYWTKAFASSNTELRIEYAFVNQYAYTHDAPETRYLHGGNPIGHRIGTDADQLKISIGHWLTSQIQISMEFDRERHGEGDVTKSTPYRRASETAEPAKPHWEYLSGTVDAKRTIAIGFLLHSIGRYLVDLKYQFVDHRNIENQNGNDRKENHLLLRTLYNF